MRRPSSTWHLGSQTLASSSVQCTFDATLHATASGPTTRPNSHLKPHPLHAVAWEIRDPTLPRRISRVPLNHPPCHSLWNVRRCARVVQVNALQATPQGRLHIRIGPIHVQLGSLVDRGRQRAVGQQLVRRRAVLANSPWRTPVRTGPGRVSQSRHNTPLQGDARTRMGSYSPLPIPKSQGPKARTQCL